MRYYIQRKHIASLEETEFEEYWDLMEKALCRLAAECSRNDMKSEIDELKSAKLDLVSEELRNLRVNTRYFFEDFLDKREFAVTDSFEKAKKILADKNIVILASYPGEGKTEMAARLALSLSQHRHCLRLSNPQDWRYIDLSLKLVDRIIIDDIFGTGALDERILGEWRLYLPEIEMAAKRKAVRVIITIGLYILKESLCQLGSLPLFRDENETIVLLSSADLTDNEKSRILKIQSNRNKIAVSEMLVRACVEASRDPTEENTGFLFGFPECASIFIRSKEMYNQGASFFKNPAMYLKSYLEDLYRKDKDNFFALVALWAKENKRLARGEVKSEETVSEHMQRIAEVFDYDVDRTFLELLQLSLETHIGGYLVFDDRREEYFFSYNIIGDMVGIVIGKRKPLESIEICPRDFLMEYISVDDAANDEFKIVVKDIHFPLLADKFINMIIRNNCNSTDVNQAYDDFQILRREGERSNVVKMYNTIDFGLIKHKAFSSQRFVKVFIDRILQMNCVKDVFRVPVMKMQGCFLDYGISIKELDMCLMGYAWFSGSSTFAKEVLSSEIMGDENVDLSTSLLLATHSKQRESIELLLNHGARVTGDVIYIAMHNKQTALLEMLLKHPGTDVNDRGNAESGNYPLIVAARKGLIESLTCLLKSGADPGVKNDDNMTALHKAIIYKHKAVVTRLLEANAPIDVKGGAFRRTPLHLAADYDDLDLAKVLVRMGASLNVKDYRGHYTIHIAAVRGHVDIVRFLLTTDRAQDQWRISSYGSKSMIKGMSLFHIAVWKYKNNSTLLDVLIDLGADPNVQDFFGQTPLFYAIMQKEEDAVERLLAYAKTDKRQAQKQGYMPLHAAIHKGLTMIATKLARESDVNARDRYGRTPLHVACETSNFLMIYNLVNKHGADHRIVTKRGDTVFHILRRNRRNRKAYQVGNTEAELFLSERDPAFVSQLPNLRNKKGITVHITPTGRRLGAHSWQTIFDTLSETSEKSSVSAVKGSTSTSVVEGKTSFNDNDDEIYYFDPCDTYDTDDYDPLDIYDAYDFDDDDGYDVESFDLF